MMTRPTINETHEQAMLVVQNQLPTVDSDNKNELVSDKERYFTLDSENVASRYDYQL